MDEGTLRPFLPDCSPRIPLGLPRETRSLCPECLATLPARLEVRDGQVWMTKRCKDHGPCEDLIASDAELFLRFERYAFEDSARIETHYAQDPERCPAGCGLCPGHLSSASLTNLDLTNRCNLRCPFCFANANIQPYVYEPSEDQIREMMDRALNVRPRRLQAIQFSGGEPTLSPHFVAACAMAKARGLRMIQAATNGIRFAREPELAMRAAEAGLNAAYLQFDGVGDEVYEITRGVKGLWELKLKALEACRAAGIRVTLVPTLVKGINDHQVGEILKFAAAHMDAVVAVSFQPVSFTGRIDARERLAQRYTVTDIPLDVERQSGLLRAREDWYPLSIIAPFAEVADNVMGPDANGFSAMHCNSHPDCGCSAYLLVNQRTGETAPLGRVFDLDLALRMVSDLAKKTRPRASRLYGSAMFLRLLLKSYRRGRAGGPSLAQLTRTIDAISGGRVLGIARKRRYEWRLMLINSMHFQDAYNYQVDRVRRCTIHYSASDGRLYPFCTYNSGCGFRHPIEAAHSVPKAQWLSARGGQYVTEGFEG